MPFKIETIRDFLHEAGIELHSDGPFDSFYHFAVAVRAHTIAEIQARIHDYEGEEQ